MRKLVFNGFYFAGLICSLVAVMQEKWLIAIWMVVFMIFIILDQIHDTIKAHGIGENT